MISDLYYILSELPGLDFGREAGITRAEFLRECAKWLDPKKMSYLETLDGGALAPAKGDSGVIKEWKLFNADLRRETAAGRKAKKNLLGENDTPLSLEKRFERKRWDYLYEEEKNHDFEMGSLELYFLKLQILERLALFNREKGKEFFLEAVKSV